MDRLFGHAKGHGLMAGFRLGIRTRIGSFLKSRPLCPVKKEGRQFSGPKFLEESHETHRRGGRCIHSKAVKRWVRCDRRHRYGTSAGARRASLALSWQCATLRSSFVSGWHRSFKPAGEGERVRNDGHENGHQHSNTTHTKPTCTGIERPVIADELTSCGMSED